MAYTWDGMKKVEWKEIVLKHKNGGGLAGYFYLYDDGTEAAIEEGYSWSDIMKHHEDGGEFGRELAMVDLKLPDGKPIKSPTIVDISALGCLDEMEYELWNVIQEYMTLFGIRTEDDEPDWATVKAVQDKIIDVFAEAGVNFKVLADE